MPNSPDEKLHTNFRWGYAVFVIILLTVLGFIAVAILSLFAGIDFQSLGGNVALIPIEGEITGSRDSGLSFGGAVSLSPDIVEMIEKADKNPSIKAIIFEINSPGGSAVASQEIADAVQKTNKTKVAWIREVGASGAYWIASSSDYVVANRASVTGSIGVIASYLEFPGFLDRYNITYRRLVAGKYKDIGSPFKEMTSEEEAVFQESLDEMRDYFVSEVARNRHMNKKDVDKIANGLFYLGAQAKDYGLVDELGGKSEVINYIERKEKIKAEIVEYKKHRGLIDVLGDALSQSSFYVGKGIGSEVLDKTTASTISINT
ncbi:MAG TPA: signal peptide peptidase SppA [Candidatus Nanoarchaeia archaeon]|nr:signal peptide peptidase SppA [Candidatus Nanoarchaeia archaeon]